MIAWQNKVIKHGDHSSVQRIKIVDSSELKVTKLLINFFIFICRYIDLKKGILLKKTRNHSQPLQLQQNIKICHKFT